MVINVSCVTVGGRTQPECVVATTIKQAITSLGVHSDASAKNAEQRLLNIQEKNSICNIESLNAASFLMAQK